MGTREQYIETVNLAEKFAKFDAHWSPKIVGELNDCYVKLVKFQGDFIWHHHDTEDEMFLVVRGGMIVRFRDRELAVGEGEFVIIPHGVEHQTAAAEECHALLLEPKTVVNTGTERNARTADLEWV